MYQLVRNPYREQRSASGCLCCLIFFASVLGVSIIVGIYASLAKNIIPGFLIINSLNEAETTKAFGEFIGKYNRAYASKEEYEYRYKIFVKNYQYIAESNADPRNTFTLEANQFADLTDEEFSKYYLTKPRPFPKAESGNAPPNDDLNIDWRNKTTDVKDQGMCGSCWTFSSVSVFETLVANRNKKNVESYSEQELVDCCRTGGGKKECIISEGCDGGEEEEALKYIAEYGIVNRMNYPYTATDNKCNTEGIPHIKQGNMKHLNLTNNTIMEKAIRNNSISVAVAAGHYAFRFYKSGVVNRGCPGDAISHAVTVVGANSTEDKVPYWLVRNSWGANWGDAGHLKLKRVEDGCGICGVSCYGKIPYVEEKGSQ